MPQWGPALDHCHDGLRPAIRLLVLCAALAAATFAAPASAAKRAVVLDVNGTIGPAMADYIARELKDLTPTDVGIVVLRMNTPGERSTDSG